MCVCVCLKGAVELSPKRDEKSPDEVPYCMVAGQVTPESHSLTSNFNRKNRGVIRVCEVKGHRVRFSSDMKTDSERTLSKDSDFEPFKLTKRNLSVKIEEPMNAKYILDNLSNTYKHFGVN